MTTNLFATKIPIEANFLDIVREIEALGKIKHITISKSKSSHEEEFQSAFLEYETPEDAAAVLEYGSSGKKDKLVSEQMLNDKVVDICGKQIVILPQVERESILNRRDKKDKRHIHLIYEGHITPNDPAAKGVSASDMAKRKKLWDEKQKKLADANYSVVPTRLCVMNVPDGIETGRIRKIFAVASQRYSRNHKKFPECQKAMKTPVRITEVRKVESQKGLFFVEFTTHEHALCALRQTNNNPEYFDGQRMIVEFAITSSFATKERREKLEKKKKEKLERLNKKERGSRIQYGDDPEPDSEDSEKEELE